MLFLKTLIKKEILTVTKVGLSAATFFIVVIFSAVCWGDTIHFDDLPRLLQEQNFKLKGHNSFVNAAQSRTKHLQRSFLPKITARGGGESFKTLDQSWKTEPTASLETRINLLEGGRDSVEESIRKKQLSIEKTITQKGYLLELQRARDLYIQVLYFRTLDRLYQEALHRNRKNIQLVKQRIDAGLTTETDQIDFEIEQGRLKQERAIIEEEQEHTTELLQSLLGIPLDQKVTFKGTLKHNHDDDLFVDDYDMSTHHEIALLDQKKQELDLSKKKANLWWTPSIDLYTNYHLHSFRERERTRLSNRDEIVTGFQLKMNLFDGFESRSRAKSFKQKAEGTEMLLAQKKRELAAQFRKIQHTLKLRHRLVHDVEKTVHKTKQYLALTRDEYERGTKNSPDVLSASQRILTQKRRYSEIRRDFLLTKNQLLGFLGK